MKQKFLPFLRFHNEGYSVNRSVPVSDMPQYSVLSRDFGSAYYFLFPVKKRTKVLLAKVNVSEIRNHSLLVGRQLSYNEPLLDGCLKGRPLNRISIGLEIPNRNTAETQQGLQLYTYNWVCNICLESPNIDQLVFEITAECSLEYHFIFLHIFNL